MIGCEKDAMVTENEIIDENSVSYYKTAKKEDVLNYLNSEKHKKKSSFVTSINIAGLKIEPLVNTDQLITVVPATTKYEHTFSRLLLMEVQNEIEAVAFIMHGTEEDKTTNFTGEIMVADLDGNFIIGYRVKQGMLTHTVFDNNNSNKLSSKCETDDSCGFHMSQGDVVVTAPIPYVSITHIYPNNDGGGGENTYYSPGGGAGTVSTGAFSFNLNEMIFDEGDKPLEEYDDKCTGISRVWELSQRDGDEYAAVLTLDGAILITQQLGTRGGGISGIYNYNGTTYYQYPASQGRPSRTYSGQLNSSDRYFIPIIATMHSHTPCINDGTNGITNNTINDDQNFANYYPNINHYIIGCNAVGQFNGSSNQVFNVHTGNLNTICNNIN
ncbi:hypothetical protein [uncultured Salegentibacter sp.]|uniref:hypothetical protein n=1 Tax=uncultured Salegentibacter sp. TaxID=259320 RepID=UPI00259868D9|nr:hypothetical protein [uncultured Salegentibacter sp.]